MDGAKFILNWVVNKVRPIQLHGQYHLSIAYQRYMVSAYVSVNKHYRYIDILYVGGSLETVHILVTIL